MKKKIEKVLLLVTAIIALTVCLVFGVCAEEFTDGDYKYIVEGNKAIITDYVGGDGDFTIFVPESVGGYPISTIENNAFFDLTYITGIYFPDSVVTIAEGAVSCCKSIRNITLGINATYLSGASFFNCEKLERIDVAEENKSFLDEDGVLYNKDKTIIVKYPSNKEDADFSIPYGIIKIGNSAFRYCKNLKSVSIPSSVTCIDNYAFQMCVSLADVDIPNNVTYIGNNAFDNCFSFTSIVVPDSVTDIGDYAFACSWPIDDATYSSKLESAELSENITSIGEGLFYQCTKLQKINIPEKVTEIGEAAFEQCYNLSDVEFPDGLNSLGRYVLKNTAYYYDESNWKNNCLYVGDYLIKADTEISGMYEIILGTKLIADGAFEYCDGITNIIIPDGIEVIANGTFKWCDALESVTIPQSVKKITYRAFDECWSLTDVYFAGTETEWNEITIGKSNEYLTNATIHFAEEPHTHTYTSTTKAPTCTVTGITTYTCSCGDSYTKTIAKKSHTSDKGTVTKKATYTSTGTKTYKCTTCKVTLKTEEIKRLTLSKVSGLKASSIGTTSLKFTWSKVTGAEKYEVYYSTNSKSWKKVTTSKNSVTVKKLKTGTTYKVKVRAVAGTNTGSYSSVLTTSTKPSKVTLTKLKAGKKKLTAQWKTISGVTGYEVVYSTSKKFTKKTTKTVTVKKAKTKKTTLKKLKSGKKYYVKVRAYKVVNGKKIYGSYSSVKTVKVK